MKCEKCQRQALFQITEIESDDEFEEHHFCEECAQEFLRAQSPKKYESLESSSAATKKCNHCGMKIQDFRNAGRLGCPHDYEVFREELQPLLETIHGGTKHLGKTPRAQHRDQRKILQLSKYKEDLAKAVRKEDYEAAAHLRDQIRALEKELNR